MTTNLMVKLICEILQDPPDDAYKRLQKSMRLSSLYGSSTCTWVYLNTQPRHGFSCEGCPLYTDPGLCIVNPSNPQLKAFEQQYFPELLI